MVDIAHSTRSGVQQKGGGGGGASGPSPKSAPVYEFDTTFIILNLSTPWTLNFASLRGNRGS